MLRLFLPQNPNDETMQTFSHTFDNIIHVEFFLIDGMYQYNNNCVYFSFVSLFSHVVFISYLIMFRYVYLHYMIVFITYFEIMQLSVLLQ